MATKKSAKKAPRREDFNEAAFRIVQQATKAKTKTRRKGPAK